jgi:hypothetical protein
MTTTLVLFFAAVADSQDYGSFRDIVSGATALVAAAAAVLRLVRGGARWEPAEEDLPLRITGILTAILMGLMWWRYSAGQHEAELLLWVASSLIISFVGLVAYLILINTMMYKVVEIEEFKQPPFRRPVVKNIIAGFRLTKQAAVACEGNPSESLQEVLAGFQYDVDRVWNRPSRTLAKLAFLLSAMALTTGLSAGLIAVSLLVRE